MLYASLAIVLLLYLDLIWIAAVSRHNRPANCELTSDPKKLNSFLWRLQGDPPSYLFGTIHVPYTKVWDFIPDNTKQAFEQADYVFFELDLTDPYTISALAKCQLLPHGENLSDVLPEDIYHRLKQHLDYVKFMMPAWVTDDQKGRGLYGDYLFNAIAGNWERKRPVWIMLMVNSLTESDVKARGIPVLDLYLAQEAERLNKINGAVEKVEEQCVPLNELNFSQVLFALNQTLRQHETYRKSKVAMPYTTDDLIHHYNCGDLNSIIFNQDSAQFPSLVNTSLPPHDLQTAKMIDSYFRNELIHKRNRRMASRVGDLIRSHPKRSFFFAFGAGHFMGNHTVIDYLRKAGFVIEHTSPEYDISDTTNKKTRKSRRRKKFNLQDSKEFQFPSGVANEQMHYFLRNRQRMNKKRHQQHQMKKKNLSSPEKIQFNDLWVRINTQNPNGMLLPQVANIDDLWTTTEKNRRSKHFHVRSYSSAAQEDMAKRSPLLLICVVISFISTLTRLLMAH